MIKASVRILEQDIFPDYTLLKAELGESYYDFNNFTMIAPTNDGKISFEHFSSVIIDWLNDKVLPRILENNKQRVLDAIPPSPLYNVENILKNAFILEDESSENSDDIGRQGTCFYLKNVGFVTCAHVLTPNTQCFSRFNFHKKYPIQVVNRNEIIDLAVLEIPDLVKDLSIAGLETGSADTLSQMDHVAVAGYPNYREGDTGVLSPGLIIGFRPTHGIRRLLVNAAIISGNSGGPVVDAGNKVIGIAVTGADCSERVMETENHGVIPIEALEYLL